MTDAQVPTEVGRNRRWKGRTDKENQPSKPLTPPASKTEP